MARLFASDAGCKGATLATGGDYRADKKGFINVSDSRDIKALKAGGYVEAGSMNVRSAKYWRCEPCNWDANINHCAKCGSSALTRVET